MGCHFLIQAIFQTHELNPGLLHYRRTTALQANSLPTELRGEPWFSFTSDQSLSRIQIFVTPMDCSMPGFPVHHQFLELAQTHVH